MILHGIAGMKRRPAMSDVKYPLITSRQMSHSQAVLPYAWWRARQEIGGALDQSVPPLVALVPQ